MTKVEVTLRLINQSGLHARPAAKFVQHAKTFNSRILVKKGEKIVDAKNILGVLSLGAECGDDITIIVEGDDAEEALKALGELVKNKFGEE